jgi:hypothetical protein
LIPLEGYGFYSFTISFIVNNAKLITSFIVPFYRIWNYIKDGGIEGNYDEKKSKYRYETIEYGTLYLNSLPTTISNKFTAEVKK